MDLEFGRIVNEPGKSNYLGVMYEMHYVPWFIHNMIWIASELHVKVSVEKILNGANVNFRFLCCLFLIFQIKNAWKKG
jgi:hypothetical protein